MVEGVLKRASFHALSRIGVIAIAEAFSRGIPILAYHGISERQDSLLRNVRRLHVWRGSFEGHLRLLCSQWCPLPLSALWEAAETRQPLPARSVIVTLDDGYRNIITVALPLLRRFKVPATVFVLTGGRQRRMWVDRLEWAIEATTVPSLSWQNWTFPLRSIVERVGAMRTLASMLQGLGTRREAALEMLLRRLGNPREEADSDRDLLTWDDVRALRDAGLEIGSHADCHEPLTQRPLEDIRCALWESREVLELQLGRGRYALSYPYGAWNRESARAAQDAGFACAVTGDPGLNRTGGDLFGLKRLLIGADDDIPRLRASLSGLRSFWKPNPGYSFA